MLEDKQHKEKVVEKEQGTEIAPGAEPDELSDADVELVAGGSQPVGFTGPQCGKHTFGSCGGVIP